MAKQPTKKSARKAAQKAAAPAGKTNVPAKKAASPARKTTRGVAKKAVPTKKSATKKPAARKAATKKAATKNAPPPTTTVIARYDAGFGNQLFLRGSGGGLSWDQGVLMENTQADEWVWETTSASGELEFKVLLNDTEWSTGQNGIVFAGATVVFEPVF